MDRMRLARWICVSRSPSPEAFARASSQGTSPPSSFGTRCAEQPALWRQQLARLTSICTPANITINSAHVAGRFQRLLGGEDLLLHSTLGESAVPTRTRRSYTPVQHLHRRPKPFRANTASQRRRRRPGAAQTECNSGARYTRQSANRGQSARQCPDRVQPGSQSARRCPDGVQLGGQVHQTERESGAKLPTPDRVQNGGRLPPRQSAVRGPVPSRRRLALWCW